MSVAFFIRRNHLTRLADELVTFNIPRYRIGPDFVREYHKHFPISSPEEDYEDRNRLYSMYVRSESVSYHLKQLMM